MRGHVDANGLIALHEGPQEQGYVLYVISGTGKMTLNDKDGKKYGDITYKPDDVLLFHPHTWHGWINGDTPFEFLGFDMQGKKVTPAYRHEQQIHRGNSISRINGDTAFEFLGFDMPVLRK